jgi:hypothetical protein
MSAAAAASCTWSSQYQYVGQQSVNNWEGVEATLGYLNLPVGNYNYQHALALVSADNFSSSNCTRYPADTHCWIQVGYGVGYIGDTAVHHMATSCCEAYEENNDDNGYNNDFYSNIALGTANYFSNFNAWVYSSGHN